MAGPSYAARTAPTPMPVEDAQPAHSGQVYPRHIGGGWYELSDGEHVQGKENAEEQEALL